MPLPWKKSKSGRMSRFVSDFQQSPKHGGSLVVETGFPTSLIDLFVKNRDRLKKTSSKRKTQQAGPNHSHPTRRRVSSPPPSPPPSLSLQRRRLLPQKLDQASVTDDLAAGKIQESFVGVGVGGGGLTAEDRNDGDGEDGVVRGGGGGCVLMVVAFKVFVVAVLALSTKRLAVGITLSAFSLLFLELAVARVFTLLNLCPDAQVRLDSLMGKLIGKRRKETLEEEKSSSPTHERRNKVTFEIIEEPRDYSEEIHVLQSNVDDSSSSTLEKAKPVVVAGEREVQTIRDVVFKKEKSKSSKLKSKIVKKIVPKKLRSYKKKKKMKIKEKEDEEEDVEVIEIIGEEEESVTEVSSLFSDERIGSEISERDEIGSIPPLFESCEEIEEEEEEGSKGDLTKAMVLIVIVLTGLLYGKLLAIGLTLSSCLILRLVCFKSQTSL